MARAVICWGFIGDNGTGKTVTMRERISRWKKTRPNGIVAAFDPTEVLTGLYDIELDIDDWYKQVHGLKNALVVLDEFKVLHPNDRVDKRFHRWFAMRRKLSIDIMYSVHNPSLILEYLTGYSDKYFLYYTQTKEGTFKRKVKNYAVCHYSSSLINKYVATYYSDYDDYEKLYPNFPYIVVTNKTGSMNTINMDGRKIKAIK